MKTEKPLLLNGKPIDLRRPTPGIDRLIAYLDKLPDNEIQDVDAVIVGSGFSRDGVQTAARSDSRLAVYRLLTSAGVTNKRYLWETVVEISRHDMMCEVGDKRGPCTRGSGDSLRNPSEPMPSVSGPVAPSKELHQSVDGPVFLLRRQTGDLGASTSSRRECFVINTQSNVRVGYCEMHA